MMSMENNNASKERGRLGRETRWNGVGQQTRDASVAGINNHDSRFGRRVMSHSEWDPGSLRTLGSPFVESTLTGTCNIPAACRVCSALESYVLARPFSSLSFQGDL
jgi:hypothetical protein